MEQKWFFINMRLYNQLNNRKDEVHFGSDQSVLFPISSYQKIFSLEKKISKYMNWQIMVNRY